MIFIWGFRVVAFLCQWWRKQSLPGRRPDTAVGKRRGLAEYWAFCFIQPETVVSRVGRSASRAALCFIFVVSSFPWQFEFAFFYDKIPVYCLQRELRVAVTRRWFVVRDCVGGGVTDGQTDGWLTFGYSMCSNGTGGRDKKTTTDINEMKGEFLGTTDGTRYVW